MREYLELLRDGRDLYKSFRSINWDILHTDDIAVEAHGKWAGLQFADCITSAFFQALEPNRYGNYEPRYATALQPRLVRRNGSALNTGLSVVPSAFKADCDDVQLAFLRGFSGLGG
jgi:hypothetical protein